MTIDLKTSQPRVAVIGGGAAGYFAAITCAEKNPNLQVHILEATQRTLTKVRLSGGGRCNVTHGCFDPKILVTHYPRGQKELLGPFHRFQPRDTIAWFEAKGVKLKCEPDGRMFPTTDSSETIAQCLEEAARSAGVTVRLGTIVKSLSYQDGFKLTLRDSAEDFDFVVLATGGSPAGFALAGALGHHMVSPVPSLFTFNIKDPRLTDQSGVSFAAVTLTLNTPSKKFVQNGPLLITHWGLSGPGVLKLSAWAARELYEANYRASLKINFLDRDTREHVRASLLQFKSQHPKKMIATDPPVAIARRYWQTLVHLTAPSADLTWSDVSHATLDLLVKELCEATFQVEGKGVFKEEFVTAGGVPLHEVDFRTMESRRCPGLYFAGEILDIDGVTGGFNFQNAWTTGWTAGTSISSENTA